MTRKKLAPFVALLFLALLVHQRHPIAIADDCEDADECMVVVAERMDCTEGWVCTDGRPFHDQIDCYSSLTGEPAARITSPYGEEREHSRHNGVDLGVPTGTPVYAAKEGIVEVVVDKFAEGDRSTLNGNYVRIQYDDGTVGAYLHLKSVVVDEGNGVDAGDLIGKSNDTGRGSGPHLHYTQFSDRTRRSTQNPVDIHSDC